MDKPSLRSRQQAWRHALDPERFRADIERALTHLRASAPWQQAGTVALYAALPGEPDLSGLAREAWSAGTRVALPITPRRGQPLIWREHRDGVALVRGRFDVPVPPPGATAVDPEAIDLVVVPALAVDVRGNRLGYGGGYYDRTLPTLTRATAVWLGLDEQVLPAVPVEATDRPVQALITPSGWQTIPGSARS